MSEWEGKESRMKEHPSLQTVISFLSLWSSLHLPHSNNSLFFFLLTPLSCPVSPFMLLFSCLLCHRIPFWYTLECNKFNSTTLIIESHLCLKVCISERERERKKTYAKSDTLRHSNNNNIQSLSIYWDCYSSLLLLFTPNICFNTHIHSIVFCFGGRSKRFVIRVIDIYGLLNEEERENRKEKTGEKGY